MVQEQNIAVVRARLDELRIRNGDQTDITIAAAEVATLCALLAPKPPPVLSAEDLAFEFDVYARNPKRKLIRRFDFPTRVRDARALYIFEINQHDERNAALLADTKMTDGERRSYDGANRAIVANLMELSICGVILERDGVIERRHVNADNPVPDLDSWSTKAWGAIRGFFADLNGLPDDELGEAIGAARDLRGPASRGTHAPA